MDRIIRSLLIMLCACTMSAQADTHKEYAKAAALFAQHKWQDALQVYETIEPKTSSLWYNMGNCAFNVHDYAYALYCWLSAIPGSTVKELYRIKQHINLLTVPNEESGEHKPMMTIQWQDWGLHATSWLMLQLLFLAVWFCIIFLFVYRYRIEFIWIGSTGLCIIIFIMLNKYWIDCRSYAIIKDNQTTVLIGPDNHFHSLGLVHQADCMRIKQEKKGWVLIQGHGIEGWIKATSIYRV